MSTANVLWDFTGAVLSADRVYRYALTRKWGEGPCVTWIMINPSTADETANDATIRKCMGFSERWGYGRMIVLNLFALRSTDPRELAKHPDPVGPENEFFLENALKESTGVICAWGCQQHIRTGLMKTHQATMLSKIERSGVPCWCLGLRKDGAPKHPLMLGYATERRQFFS